MKNRFLLLSAVLLVTLSVAFGVTYTKQSYVQMTSSLIDSTTIGQTTPAPGVFTSLGASNASLGVLNATNIGTSQPGTGAFTNLNATNGTFGTITANSGNFTSFTTTKINSTPIGPDTPSTGNFTTMTANTANVTNGNFTNLTANNHVGPIGNGNPNTGNFTTLTANTGAFGSITSGNGGFSGTITAPTANITTVNATNGTFTNFSTSKINGTPIGPDAASTGNFTNLTAINLSATRMDATVIGANSPAAGTFTNLNATNGSFSNGFADNMNVNHLKWQGGATNAYVLTGNGAEFIPQPLPVIPPSSLVVSNTQSGCNFPQFNNLVSCGGTFSWPGGAFQDANYNIIGCMAYTGNGASVIVSESGPKSATGFSFTQTLVMINGSGSFVPQITCSAVHP